MMHFTIEQCVFIANFVQDSYILFHHLERVHGKFRQTGSVDDAKHTGRPKIGRSNVNI